MEEKGAILPTEIKIRRDEIESRELQKAKEGKARMHTTHQVALKHYTIGGKTDIEEDMEITFHFIPNDYYTFQATVGSMNYQLPETNTTVREQFIDPIKDKKHPVSYLANGVGIVLALITADDKLVLTKRSEHTGIRKGEYDVSIVEGIDAVKDKGSGLGPDIYRAARRATMEELKVDVSEEDILILGFGVDEEYYQWNFIDYVRTKYTAQEIVENKTRGIHASNELKELIFIDYHPEVVVVELREKKCGAPLK